MKSFYKTIDSVIHYIDNHDRFLILSNLDIVYIHLSEHSQVIVLDVSNNHIKELSLECNHLEMLICKNNNIDYLNINSKVLYSLICYENNIDYFKISWQTIRNIMADKSLFKDAPKDSILKVTERDGDIEILNLYGKNLEMIKNYITFEEQ